MSADRVVAALATVARDVAAALQAAGGDEGRAGLPALIRQLQMEQSTGHQRAAATEAVTQHVHHSTCVFAIEQDPDLAALKPDAAGMDPFVMTRSGGSRIDIESLPLAVIIGAITELAVRGLEITAESLEIRVSESIQRLRRAIAGEAIPVTTVLGYNGVPLQAGCVIKMPWGQMLKAAGPSWLTPPSLYGPRRVDANADAVLIATTEEPVRIDYAPEPEFVPEPFDVAMRRHEIAATLVPLSLILGTAGDDPARTVLLWETPIEPWSNGQGWSSWHTPIGPRTRASLIGPQDIAEIERWARLVDSHYHDQLAFAGRRIVSAVSRRSSIEDVLVDAVVAWENLVGGAPETTFRTTAAMACLLEKGGRRKELQRQLATVYRARSDVVHGRLGPDPTGWKWSLFQGEEKVGIEAVARAAVDAAIRAFKALVEWRPDLIPLGASDRSADILLGGGVATEGAASHPA